METKLRLYCDDCGHPITELDQAELAWGWNDEERKRVLVVHALYACPKWKHHMDHLPETVPARGTVNLQHFLGRCGLVELLAWIEKGDFPTKVGLELVRRLHVLDYEQYRRHRAEARRRGTDPEFPALPDGAAFESFLEARKERKIKRT